MRAHHAMHHRQPEAGAATSTLHGKERFENPLARCRVHAHAGILHGEHRPRGRGIQRRGRRLAGAERAQPDRDAAGPALKRLPGVQAEVHDGLLDLRCISLGEGRATLDEQREIRSGLEDRPQARHAPLDRAGQRGGGSARSLDAGKGENLPDKVGGALAGFEDGSDIGVRRVPVGRELKTRELGVAEDGGEDVVEVVRDPARERAQRLEPLGLAELGLLLRAARLGPLPLGEIAEEGAGAAPAAGVRVERGRHLDGKERAIAPAVGQLPVKCAGGSARGQGGG